jgi:hypothetical protein
MYGRVWRCKQCSVRRWRQAVFVTTGKRQTPVKLDEVPAVEYMRNRKLSSNREVSGAAGDAQQEKRNRRNAGTSCKIESWTIECRVRCVCLPDGAYQISTQFLPQWGRNEADVWNRMETFTKMRIHVMQRWFLMWELLGVAWRASVIFIISKLRDSISDRASFRETASAWNPVNRNSNGRLQRETRKFNFDLVVRLFCGKIMQYMLIGGCESWKYPCTASVWSVAVIVESVPSLNSVWRRFMWFRVSVSVWSCWFTKQCKNMSHAKFRCFGIFNAVSLPIDFQKYSQRVHIIVNSAVERGES